MSLDVWLNDETPRACEHCGGSGVIKSRKVFESNITHNLGRMAEEAGIYEACWRPEEIGVETAGELIPRLRSGIERLKNDPARYSRFDASNGWGTYEQFVPWVEEYLTACERYPDAAVFVSR